MPAIGRYGNYYTWRKMQEFSDSYGSNQHRDKNETMVFERFEQRQDDEATVDPGRDS